MPIRDINKTHAVKIIFNPLRQSDYCDLDWSMVKAKEYCLVIGRWLVVNGWISSAEAP